MWNNLEHQVWNTLKQHDLDQSETYLLAVSGGLDSMVLYAVLKKIKPQANLILMHFHHGPGVNTKYRDACLDLLKQQVHENVCLEWEKSTTTLPSEQELRTARLNFFEKIKNKYHVTYYFTAHHLDDVFETRLLKMIRGVGLEGLEAFQEWNRKILRPFMNQRKVVLLNYARNENITWLEDPTNLENEYLRNWLRNVWLPQLDQKQPGARDNLSRSLQNVIDEAVANEDRYASESARYVTRSDQSVAIDKAWFFSFSSKDQLLVLIRVLKSSFHSDFSTSQIKEVLRRLDKNQNEHIFQVASINWVINTRSIVLNYIKT